MPVFLALREHGTAFTDVALSTRSSATLAGSAARTPPASVLNTE